MTYNTPEQNNPFYPPGSQQIGSVDPNTKKVGWPGIVAIVIGVLSGLMLVVAVGYATYLVIQANPAEVDDESPEMIIAGLSIIAGVALSLLGLFFGVIGMFLSGSNRITAGIGIAINLILIIVIGGLMWIGTAAG